MQKHYTASLLIMLIFLLAPTEWGELFGSHREKLFEAIIDFIFGSSSAFWTALGEIVKRRVTATTRLVTSGTRQEMAWRINDPPTGLPAFIQLVSLCMASLACFCAGRYKTGVTG